MWGCVLDIICLFLPGGRRTCGRYDMPSLATYSLSTVAARVTNRSVGPLYNSSGPLGSPYDISRSVGSLYGISRSGGGSL